VLADAGPVKRFLRTLRQGFAAVRHARDLEFVRPASASLDPLVQELAVAGVLFALVVRVLRGPAEADGTLPLATWSAQLAGCAAWLNEVHGPGLPVERLVGPELAGRAAWPGLTPTAFGEALAGLDAFEVRGRIIRAPLEVGRWLVGRLAALARQG
jgi:hypothetical protein